MKKLTRIMAWFNWLLFGIQAVPELRALPAPAPQAPAPAPRRVPKARNYTKATIGELLDDIGKTFKALTRNSCVQSWTNRQTRIGLKRLGPTVIPHAWKHDEKSTGGGRWSPIVDPIIKDISSVDFPTLIFVAVNEGDFSADGYMYPDFLYAVRLDKRPAYTLVKGDVIYETGAAFRGMLSKRLMWIAFHIGIDKSTGSVRAGRELFKEHVPIERHSGSGYTRNVWRAPINDKDWGDEGRQLQHLAHIFSITFEWWKRKSAYWSVSVRHDGRRCTFAIHPKSTASYFRDRGRTALTAGGKLRPIIHHVREHARVLPSGRETSVKEHIRGLRSFYWKGYQCAVTAPDFHRWSVDKFTLPGFLEEEDVDAEHMITLDNLGAALAASEDQQEPVCLPSSRTAKAA